MGISGYHTKEELYLLCVNRYKEWKTEHSAPRTQTEINEMFEFVLLPILEFLNEWEVYEETSTHKLNEIRNILDKDLVYFFPKEKTNGTT